MESMLPIIKAFLSQMDSAMKISDMLAKHDNSNEITVDHIITGLVYRLMVPMTNKQIQESLESAQQILNKLDHTDSEDSDYDEIDECYSSDITFGSRKVIPPKCNCDICMKARLCLLNYHSYDCSDPLADKFKNAIQETCEKHKIYI